MSTQIVKTDDGFRWYRVEMNGGIVISQLFGAEEGKATCGVSIVFPPKEFSDVFAAAVDLINEEVARQRNLPDIVSDQGDG